MRSVRESNSPPPCGGTRFSKPARTQLRVAAPEADGVRVELTARLSTSTRFRGERTCLCANPSISGESESRTRRPPFDDRSVSSRVGLPMPNLSNPSDDRLRARGPVGRVVARHLAVASSDLSFPRDCLRRAEDSNPTPRRVLTAFKADRRPPTVHPPTFTRREPSGGGRCARRSASGR